MTLAFSFDQPLQQTEHQPVFSEFSLQQKVHLAIAAHTEFSLDRILTQDNRVKYTNAGSRETSTDHLDEVFQLMRQLNEGGIASDDLGRLHADGRSFRNALEESCAAVASDYSGKRLTYVELGPEPVKTSFILQTLIRMGVSIDRYIAVDINPKSADPMKAALEKILPGTDLSFVTASFEEVRLAELVGDGAPPALITMLGFQEGNDDPFVVNDWLAGIARPGDLLLSESQLLHHRTNRQDFPVSMPIRPCSGFLASHSNGRSTATSRPSTGSSCCRSPSETDTAPKWPFWRRNLPVQSMQETCMFPTSA